MSSRPMKMGVTIRRDLGLGERAVRGGRLVGKQDGLDIDVAVNVD